VLELEADGIRRRIADMGLTVNQLMRWCDREGG
jgi:hypothetical protein